MSDRNPLYADLLAVVEAARAVVKPGGRYSEDFDRCRDALSTLDSAKGWLLEDVEAAVLAFAGPENMKHAARAAIRAIGVKEVSDG